MFRSDVQLQVITFIGFLLTAIFINSAFAEAPVTESKKTQLLQDSSTMLKEF